MRVLRQRKSTNARATEVSRILRARQTDAERRLWQYLRDRGLAGFKFLRQYPIAGYIADFCCFERGLVVEVDGGQHGEVVERDSVRTAAMERHGFRVIRFWNNDVLQNTERVLAAVLTAPEDPHPRPLPVPFRGFRCRGTGEAEEPDA